MGIKLLNRLKTVLLEKTFYKSGNLTLSVLTIVKTGQLHHFFAD
jgi:hypothetical protein